MSYGVPQCSAIGPVLVHIYMFTLIYIIHKDKVTITVIQILLNFKLYTLFAMTLLPMGTNEPKPCQHLQLLRFITNFFRIYHVCECEVTVTLTFDL